jgi:hypothetical protein
MAGYCTVMDTMPGVQTTPILEETGPLSGVPFTLTANAAAPPQLIPLANIE